MRYEIKKDEKLFLIKGSLCMCGKSQKYQHYYEVFACRFTFV